MPPVVRNLRRIYKFTNVLRGSMGECGSCGCFREGNVSSVLHLLKESPRIFGTRDEMFVAEKCLIEKSAFTFPARVNGLNAVTRNSFNRAGKRITSRWSVLLTAVCALDCCLSCQLVMCPSFFCGEEMNSYKEHFNYFNELHISVLPCQEQTVLQHFLSYLKIRITKMHL